MDITAAGKMDYKKRYFNLLFKYLNKNELLPFEKQDRWRYDLQKYFDEAEIDLDIISKMKEQYGTGFENVFLINCKKNALVCDHFQIEQNRISLQTAVYFTVLGCLLDHLLDYGDWEQKSEAERKLSWEYCKDYFIQYTTAKEDSAIDSLYEKISIGFHEISIWNHEKFKYIIELIQIAVDSELAVNTRGIVPQNKEAIVNKSIIFVEIALEILLYKKEVMKDIDRKMFRVLGYTYALIDDLCDLYEDIENGQMNLLIEYVQMQNIDMECLIDSTVNKLSAMLKILEEHFDEPLYKFIVGEVKEWSMSCVELREQVWCLYG